MAYLPHFRWRMRSETVPGKVVTSELMTEARAREIDPLAERLDHTETRMWETLQVDEAFDPYDPRWTT